MPTHTHKSLECSPCAASRRCQKEARPRALKERRLLSSQAHHWNCESRRSLCMHSDSEITAPAASKTVVPSERSRPALLPHGGGHGTLDIWAERPISTRRERRAPCATKSAAARRDSCQAKGEVRGPPAAARPRRRRVRPPGLNPAPLVAKISRHSRLS